MKKKKKDFEYKEDSRDRSWGSHKGRFFFLSFFLFFVLLKTKHPNEKGYKNIYK